MGELHASGLKRPLVSGPRVPHLNLDSEIRRRVAPVSSLRV
jgi:hypothetical protein